MENLEQRIYAILDEKSGNQVVLDIGCGPSRRIGSIGIDCLPYENVDLVGDACHILCKFPDDSVDHIFSKHFLEHVSDLDALLFEFYRVLKKGSRVKIIVPHFSNPFFYSDPTHKQNFGLYTFCYYAHCANLFKRKVPTYMRDLNFDLVNVDLRFQAVKGSHLRSLMKKIVEFIVNKSSFNKEFYEELFCWIFPCYEVVYHLQKK